MTAADVLVTDGDSGESPAPAVPEPAATSVRADGATAVAEVAGPASAPGSAGARAKAPSESTPHVSVVVPGLNEAASLPELAERIHEALRGKIPYEIVFVDDGSTDETWEVIGDLHRKDPTLVRGVRLRKNFGKAMALTAGFRRAKGQVIVTMDADLQDDPSDLPSFLRKIEEGLDVVVGWKVDRKDPTNRLVLSRIFNGTVRLVTGVKLHDMNCGFKAYRREVIRTIPVYGDLFRFYPALAAWQGFRVAEVAVKHHARRFGTSRYGLERILRGFFDLLSIVFLTKYSRKPMHLFGLLGLLFATVGFFVDAYLTVLWFGGAKIGDRPLLLLGTMMIILGIQFFSMGFLGEFMTYQNQTKLIPDDLPIREEIR